MTAPAIPRWSVSGWATSEQETVQLRGLRPHPAPLKDQWEGVGGGDLLTARHEDSQTGTSPRREKITASTKRGKDNRHPC